MKCIEFGGKEPAIVDDTDYEWLSLFTWHDAHGYPQTHVKTADGKFKTRRMHQMISSPPVGMMTDHINRVKHDNRRCNLRHVNRSENGRNRDVLRNNTSGVTGVSWHPRVQRWCVQTHVRGKNYYVGSCMNKLDAIRMLVEFKDRLTHCPSSIPDKGPLNRNNKSGVAGVYYVCAAKKWVAQVFHKGKRHHVGTFPSLAEAAAKQAEYKSAL